MSTVFSQITALIEKVHSSDSTIETKSFLDACRAILPVVEKLGTGFALVKSDVGGNIDRLATRAATNPGVYGHDIFQIVRDEVAQGQHTGSSSCTKGLLWLKRAMQFVVALLHQLHTDRNMELSEAASTTYYATLQQYHGWIVTGTFTVALKLVPSRETFFDNVKPGAVDDATLMADLNTFCVAFSNLLMEIHTFLDSSGLDDPAKV